MSGKIRKFLVNVIMLIIAFSAFASSERILAIKSLPFEASAPAIFMLIIGAIITIIFLFGKFINWNPLWILISGDKNEYLERRERK